MMSNINSTGAAQSVGLITSKEVVLPGQFGVWTLVGLAAFLVELNYPDELQALTALGQSWLGLALAVGYAYFGINRNAA